MLPWNRLGSNPHGCALVRQLKLRRGGLLPDHIVGVQAHSRSVKSSKTADCHPVATAVKCGRATPNHHASGVAIDPGRGTHAQSRYVRRKRGLRGWLRWIRDFDKRNSGNLAVVMRVTRRLPRGRRRRAGCREPELCRGLPGCLWRRRPDAAVFGFFRIGRWSRPPAGCSCCFVEPRWTTGPPLPQRDGRQPRTPPVVRLHSA